MSEVDTNKNLRRPWKPGESGNPNGRPKRPPEINIKKLKNNYEYQMFLQTVLGDDLKEIKPGGKYVKAAGKGEITAAQGLALKLIQMGLGGKIQHMHLLLSQIGVSTNLNEKGKKEDESSQNSRPLKQYSNQTLTIIKSAIEKDPLNEKQG